MDKTIIENIRDLASLEFNVVSVSVKSDCWHDGAEFNYIAHGRRMNLIHIVASGTRHYEFLGERFKICEGTVLFIPHSTQYRTWNSGICSGIGVCFEFGADFEIAQGIYYGWQDERGDYRRLFELLEECGSVEPKRTLRMQSLLLRILDHMTSECRSDSKYGELLAPALKFIMEHYTENLPVPEYASSCNLSESYFRRIFVRHVGMTPIEYRNSLRFDEACRLRAQGFGMSEIAERCGFCDASYLRKLFRRQTGKSIKSYTEPEIV